MKRPISRRDRRRFLHATGLTLSLPMLESTANAKDSGSDVEASTTGAKASRPICIGSNLGLYRPALHPEKIGRDKRSAGITQRRR